MARLGPAVHRTIVAVDVEGFGDRQRTDTNRVAVRAGLYRAMERAFGKAGIPWAGCWREDTGDGVLVLAAAEVPKAAFAEDLPGELAAALREHNAGCCAQERIRLRVVLHAGEVSFDEHGVTAASVNLAFRLLDASPLRAALAGSRGVLAVIVSAWFFDEVIRNAGVGGWAACRRVAVAVKETSAAAWIAMPDDPCPPGDPGQHLVSAEGDVAVPRQLPACTAHFAGRSAELAALTGLLDSAGAQLAGGGSAGAVVISAVGGMAGVGKTALALRWAHQVAGRFPDGQLYVNLRGFDLGGVPVAPGEAVRGFLDAFAVEPARIPVDLEAQASLYRSVLAGRRVLVVLDNARDAGQVRPLLPGSATCLVLVTSRSQLPGLVAAEGARSLPLGLLPVAEARELLARHVGSQRAAAEPQAIDELTGLCAGLPLALSTVAARAAARPAFPLAVLAAELRDVRGRLDALDAGDPATSVRAVLSWSCRHLDAAAAAMFRLLGTHPGPDISASAAASLAGVPLRQAREALAVLTRVHLLAEHVPGRFALHDLVRAYAAEQASAVDSSTVCRSALHRVLDYYLHTGHAAALLLHPIREPLTLTAPRPGVQAGEPAGYEQALAWFEAERPVLLAAIAEAAGAGLVTHAWQIPWTLADFADRRWYWHDYARAQRTALAAAERTGDLAGQAYAHLGLGRAVIARSDHPLDDVRAHLLCVRDRFARLGNRTGQARADLELGRILDAQGRYPLDDVRAHLLAARDLFARLGNRTGQARADIQLGRILAAQGRYGEALGLAQRALDLFREAGHPWQGHALNFIGWCHAHLGDPRQAVGHCEQALSLLQARGDVFYEAETWDSLGYARRHAGHHAEAIACYQHSLDLCNQIDDPDYQAVVLLHLGDVHHAAGDQDAACRAWQQALAILDSLHRPDARQVRARLLGAEPAAPPNQS